MGWLKRKSKVETSDRSFDVAAEQIAARILKWQTLFSAKLNTKAKRMNKRVLVALMVTAGLVFGGYCLWLVTSLFR